MKAGLQRILKKEHHHGNTANPRRAADTGADFDVSLTGFETAEIDAMFRDAIHDNVQVLSSNATMRRLYDSPFSATEGYIIFAFALIQQAMLKN